MYGKVCKDFPVFFCFLRRAYERRSFGLYAFLGFHAAETLKLVKGDVEVHFNVIITADADGLDKLRHDHSLCRKGAFAAQVHPAQQPAKLALSVFGGFKQGFQFQVCRIQVGQDILDLCFSFCDGCWFGRYLILSRIGWMLNNGKRKEVLAIGIVGMTLIPLGYMALSALSLVFITRMLHGASLACFNTTSSTIANDMVPMFQKLTDYSVTMNSCVCFSPFRFLYVYRFSLW